MTDQLKVVDLKVLARQHDIPGRSKMKKADLIVAINLKLKGKKDKQTAEKSHDLLLNLAQNIEKAIKTHKKPLKFSLQVQTDQLKHISLYIYPERESNNSHISFIILEYSKNDDWKKGRAPHKTRNQMQEFSKESDSELFNYPYPKSIKIKEFSNSVKKAEKAEKEDLEKIKKISNTFVNYALADNNMHKYRTDYAPVLKELRHFHQYKPEAFLLFLLVTICNIYNIDPSGFNAITYDWNVGYNDIPPDHVVLKTLILDLAKN